jgi:hypothetical protein
MTKIHALVDANGMPIRLKRSFLDTVFPHR